MNNSDAIIRNMINAIDSSITRFNSAIPKQQQVIYEHVVTLLKELDLNGNTIAQTAKNLKLIGQLQTEIDKIVTSDEWYSQVKQFINGFNVVTDYQNQYFKAASDNFKTKKVFNIIRQQSIDTTINSLTEAGITANISDPLRKILQTNITTGAKWSDLVGQVKQFIIGDNQIDGKLVSYSKQITTDALNQYAANYSQAISGYLGLEWGRYIHPIIESSRPFCVAMHEKDYFHISEIPSLLEGDFPEFQEADGVINPKTGLPSGMIAGTNPSNFPTYRGGYNCGHQIAWVSAFSVPLAKLLSIPKSKLGATSLKAIDKLQSV